MFLFDMAGYRKPLWSTGLRLGVSVVRIVWGVGTGPTATASYDAALADAGIHNYNLSHVSSVIPAGTELEVAETAPALGSPGERLTVVEARATAETGTVCAGLGWVRTASQGPGLLYEASGTDRSSVESAIEAGLAAARELRDWTFTAEDARYMEATGTGEPTTALVLGVFGPAEPIVTPE